MHAEGLSSFAVTQAGQFYAQLTQVSLGYLRLCSIKEGLPSVSFVSTPPDKILVAFSLNDGTHHVWSGCNSPPHDLVLIGPGQSVHRRSEGASYWAMIWIPVAELQDYCRSVLGRTISIRSMELRRLPTLLRSQLRTIQKFIVGATHSRSVSLMQPQVAHGLEQQIIDILLQALSHGRLQKCLSTQTRKQELMALLERLPVLSPDEHPSMARLTGALDVSEETLCRWCEETLGMDPVSYVALRR